MSKNTILTLLLIAGLGLTVWLLKPGKSVKPMTNGTSISTTSEDEPEMDMSELEPAKIQEIEKVLEAEYKEKLNSPEYQIEKAPAGAELSYTTTEEFTDDSEAMLDQVFNN